MQLHLRQRLEQRVVALQIQAGVDRGRQRDIQHARGRHAQGSCGEHGASDGSAARRSGECRVSLLATTCWLERLGLWGRRCAGKRLPHPSPGGNNGKAKHSRPPVCLMSLRIPPMISSMRPRVSGRDRKRWSASMVLKSPATLLRTRCRWRKPRAGRRFNSPHFQAP